VSGWDTAAWRRAAIAWADARLAAAGMERTGPVEQPRVRPWATVLRMPTSHGAVWLKAGAPETAFEAGLYGLLARAVPDAVLEPLALDAERGWMLLPDGGRTLRDSAPAGDALSALAAVPPRYGVLQRTLAPLTGELLALGVADMRPAVMPERFDEALAVVRDYGIDPGVHARVAALRPAFLAWCEQLAHAPAAPSLDHNDLHPANVLVAEGLNRARFYD
jgi:Phosphotransferase enzyme family